MVYALGSNGQFQLGVGHDNDISVPEKTYFEHVDLVASGGNHTIFIIDDVAYIAGTLGGHKYTKPVPVPVAGQTSKPKWKLAACGWEFVILVNENNQIYSMGHGARGELGLGHDVTNADFASAIAPFGPPDKVVVDIKAGMNHVLLLLNDGSVWGWGSSHKGQLGDAAKAIGKIWSPIEVIHDLDRRKCTAIACGRDFSVVCCERTGYIKVIGRQRKEWQDLPPVIHNIKAIGAGWSCIHMLKNDGSVESWGNDSHGQVSGHDNSRVKFKAISCGTEHVVGLESLSPTRQRLWAWGWGEHGNCGVDGLKSHNEHIIHDGQTATMFAGHANTWFA